MDQPKDAIMVNGIMLGEYLRDNESIEEEVKSKKFIREGFDNVYLNRHIKEKYKSHKEKNGKVTHLGQIEINKTEYVNRMKQAVSTYDSKSQLVLYCLNYEGDKYLKIAEIGDEIVNFAKEHNINTNERKIRHALRSAIGWIRYSKLSEYLIHHDRNTPENTDTTAKFKFKPEFRELKFDKAISLARVRDGAIQPARVRDEGDRPITKPEPPQVKPAPAKAESTDIKPLDDSKLVESIISNIQKLSTGTGELFHFDGDLVINININK